MHAGVRVMSRWSNIDLYESGALRKPKRRGHTIQNSQFSVTDDDSISARHQFLKQNTKALILQQQLENLEAEISNSNQSKEQSDKESATDSNKSVSSFTKLKNFALSLVRKSRSKTSSNKTISKSDNVSENAKNFPKYEKYLKRRAQKHQSIVPESRSKAAERKRRQQRRAKKKTQKFGSCLG